MGSNSNPLLLVSIRHNSFNDSDYGMYKSNWGSTGPQGDDNTPWLNQWNNVTTHTWASTNIIWDDYHTRTNPNNENFNWYFGFNKIPVTCIPCSSRQCMVEICNSYQTHLFAQQQTIDPSNNNIPNALNINNPSYILHNNIIANSFSLPDVASFMAKQIVYSQIMSDKNVFMQDAGFSHFITQSNNNSIGQLYHADKYIGEAKPDSAELFNNTVAISNIADSLHKFVNKCYISYLRSRNLSSGILADLRNIAVLCPFTFGDGVYIARGLLNCADTVRFDYANVCETGVINHKSLEAQSSISENENLKIMLYPNPTKDLITIEYKNTEINGGDITFELFDMMGKKLLESIIKPNQNSTLSTDELTQGIYFYKFVYRNKLIENDKLVIIK
jgi:hypothetical protein